MSKRVYWQGSHDNFCGLYAAADIISRHKTARTNDVLSHEDYFQRAFVQILKSAEKLRLLTASRIASSGDAGGFSSPHIAKIINNLGAGARAGLVAVPFKSADFRRFAAATTPRERFAGSNCAIIKDEGGRHWLSAVGVRDDGGYFCFDPNRERNITKRERIQWDDGVFIASPGAMDL